MCKSSIRWLFICTLVVFTVMVRMKRQFSAMPVFILFLGKNSGQWYRRRLLALLCWWTLLFSFDCFPFWSRQAVPPPFQEGCSHQFFGEGVSSAPAWAAVVDGAGRAVQTLLWSGTTRPGIQVVHRNNVTDWHQRHCFSFRPSGWHWFHPGRQRGDQRDTLGLVHHHPVDLVRWKIWCKRGSKWQSGSRVGCRGAVLGMVALGTPVPQLPRHDPGQPEDTDEGRAQVQPCPGQTHGPNHLPVPASPRGQLCEERGFRFGASLGTPTPADLSPAQERSVQLGEMLSWGVGLTSGCDLTQKEMKVVIMSVVGDLYSYLTLSFAPHKSYICFSHISCICYVSSCPLNQSAFFLFEAFLPNISKTVCGIFQITTTTTK